MLDGFFVIHSWTSGADGFRVRLVPDHYEEGQTEPVVTVSVTEPQNSAECEAALQLRKDELIVALETSEGVASIYAEQDHEPVRLRGGTVSIARTPYAIEDLLEFLRDKNKEVDWYHEQLRTHRAALEGAETFLSELIRRAEMKRDLTSRDSTWLDREVSVLQRALRRVRER